LHPGKFKQSSTVTADSGGVAGGELWMLNYRPIAAQHGTGTFFHGHAPIHWLAERLVNKNAPLKFLSNCKSWNGHSDCQPIDWH